MTVVHRAELFQLLDYVKAKDPENKNPHHHLESKAIVEGILDYMRDKLGKNAHKKQKLIVAFESTIQDACNQILLIFGVSDRIGQIEASNRELDEQSRDWLAAILVCDLVRSNPNAFISHAFATFSREYVATKKKGLFAKMFSTH